jgi:hypothetical protein
MEPERPARVVEPARAKSAPVEEPAAFSPEPEDDMEEPEDEVAPAAAVAKPDLASRWPELVAEIRERRPLILGWIDAGTLVSFEKGAALLAFPPSQKLAAEALSQPTHRNLLQEILTAIAGEPVTFKTLVQDSVSEKAPVVRPEKVPADPMAEFKDDPLIRRALEIFGAKIQPA